MRTFIIQVFKYLDLGVWFLKKQQHYYGKFQMYMEKGRGRRREKKRNDTAVGREDLTVFKAETY